MKETLFVCYATATLKTERKKERKKKRKEKTLSSGEDRCCGISSDQVLCGLEKRLRVECLK